MWKDRCKHLKWAWLSLACMGAGFLLYASLRPLDWMPWPALFRAPALLHQHLPDALWTASFSAALLWLGKGRSRTGMAIAWPFLMSCLLEGLQMLGLWPGTADGWDVLSAAVGSGMVYILIKLLKDEQSYFA